MKSTSADRIHYLIALIEVLEPKPPGITRDQYVQICRHFTYRGVILQALIWALTAVWWGPLMARLHQVTGPVYGDLYQQLMITQVARQGQSRHAPPRLHRE